GDDAGGRAARARHARPPPARAGALRHLLHALPRRHRARRRDGRAARLPAPSLPAHRPAAQREDGLLLRRDHERLRGHARLLGPGRGGGPLGDRGLRARAAAQRERAPGRRARGSPRGAGRVGVFGRHGPGSARSGRLSRRGAPVSTAAATHPVPELVDVLQRRAFTAGAAGLIASLIGALVTPTQFFRSYLFAFLFWNGVAIGCLSLLMIQHLTGGRWGLAIRRLLEAGTRTVPVLLVLFLPVVIGLKRIYPWAGSEQADATIRHAIAIKHAYLNVPFFLGRAAFYFAVWLLLAHFLNRLSLETDAGLDLRRARQMRSISGGGLLLMGLTITFMSVDWAMSL